MIRLALKSLSQFDLINKYFSGIATILTLHRVHPFEADKLPPNEGMKVSPEFLERFIREAKADGYEFISLDRLHEILVSGERVKKQLVFTLDDGYKDNFERAYPIFKKHNVPFTVYVTTSFPDQTAILWWHVLEDLLVQNTAILFEGIKFDCATEPQKIDAFMKIRKTIISADGGNSRGKLSGLFAGYKIDWQKKCQELAMSWAQIQALSLDPLVTIGGHTLSHYSLNSLSEAEIAFEVAEANRLIESKTSSKVNHFAYPFGSDAEIGQREFNIIKGMGFKTATTTRRGNIYPEHAKYLECLPRIMLTENMSLREAGQIRRSKVVTA